ncbi:Saposin B-type domain-containing protein [Aphelenchoides besseyi]|nr:Saposin B-type domain-containing protein [Aphelenchoides besseyi]
MKVLCLLALIPVLSLAAVVPFVPADVNVNSKVETAVVNAKASVVEAKAQVAIPKVPLNEQAKQLLDMIRARNTVDQPGLHFLCSPCKTVFTDVLVALEDVETIEEPALKAAIEGACDAWTGKFPFVDKVCKKLADVALDDLLKWLLEEEEKVNPERTCIFLHLC